MLKFLDLPEDIILSICVRLSPEDLLSVQQTCRGLHVLGSANYIWHRLKFDIPLDIPVCDLQDGTSSLPARQIQQSAVRALRLEKNWRQRESRIQRLTRIPHGDIVFQLQFLGPSFIVTLSRSVNLSTYLSLWHVQSVYRAAYIEVPYATKFTAAYEAGGAIIAVLISDGHVKGSLQIFRVLLNRNESTLTQIFTELRPHFGELFFDVHISGSIVAAALAQLGQDSTNRIEYRLFFFNVKTGVHTYFRVPVQDLGRIRFKLYHHILFMIDIQDGALVISKHPIPDLDAPSSDDWLLSTSEYRTGKFPPDFEFYISPEATTHSSESFPITVFHASTSVLSRKGVISVYTVPLHDSSSDRNHLLKAAHTFSTSFGSSPDIICVGETGRRLVWLERRWDTGEDEYRFMKAALNRGVPYVELIWPQHIGLPFRPHACQAMCFEECTGRICFALHTEEVYVMEF